jgi:hypothetical protein
VIVSHALGAAFVKTRKTAGTSIEIALSTACGPEDIITPITERDEQIRREVGGRGPQNYLAPWNEMSARKAVAVALGRRDRPKRFYNHMPAADAIRVVGRETWDRFFTFTVERNPWDKAVSRYFWERSRRSVPDFSTFLRGCPPHKLSCFDLYAIDGEIVVDEVVRFEQLTDSLPAVWERLGIRPPVLPRAKGSHRPKGIDYRSLYSDDDAAVVAEVCKREIAAFGFAF